MRYYRKRRLKVLECVSLEIGLPSCLSTCLLVCICLSASFPPSVGSGCCHTIHLIRPALPSSLPVLTELCACMCVCVWCEWAFVRPPLSRVMISTPSPALHMSWWTDRQRTLGALWLGVCVCVVVKRGKGEDWGLECVRGGVWWGCVCLCVSLCACVFLFFSSRATRPCHMAAICSLAM